MREQDTETWVLHGELQRYPRLDNIWRTQSGSEANNEAAAHSSSVFSFTYQDAHPSRRQRQTSAP